MQSQVSTAELLAHVSFLMAHSPLHKRWFVEDLFRLILPPIQFGQAVYHIEGDRLLGFGTFALMTPEKAWDFLNRKYRLQASDFRCGDVPVLVDAIAPFGHASKITRKIRNALVESGYKGKPILFRRDYEGRYRISEAVL